MKSTALTWLPKPCGKGVGAEAEELAISLLAARIIFVLLSLMRSAIGSNAFSLLDG